MPPDLHSSQRECRPRLIPSVPGPGPVGDPGAHCSLGDDETILGTAGPRTVTVDARGLTVLPGFNDNHLHALGMGLFFRHPNLFGKNADEIVAA